MRPPGPRVTLEPSRNSGAKALFKLADMTLASSLRPSMRPALAVALVVFALGLSSRLRAEEANAEATLDAEGEGRATRTAPADNSGNPYASIVVRNAFRLKDPLPPPPPPTNAAPVAETPKVDVKLAGLSQIRGVRYAYLMVPDADRPGQFVYPALTDDPNAGAVRHGTGLEVKQIDLKTKSVRLVNGGIEATINFDDNGIKNVATAPKPGGPPAPGGVLPNNAQRPGVVPAPGAPNSAAVNPASAEPLVFSRNPNRASGGNAAATAQAASANSVSAAADRAISNLNLPNRPLRTGTGGGVVSTPVTTPSTPINTPNTPSLPIEHQYEILIRQKQAAEAAGISLPPIPGVPFPSDPQ